MPAASTVSLYDVFSDRVASYVGRTAIVDGDVRLSYSELGGRVSRLAGALSSLGVGPRDRVAWVGQNSFRVLEVLLASARLGAICCPVNWRLGDHELRAVLDDLEPAVLFGEHNLSEATERELTGRAPGVVWVHDEGDPGGYELVLRSADETSTDRQPVDGAEPLLALSTGGSDGRPRAALLSHTALVAQSSVIGRVHEITEHAVCLDSAPMFHIAVFMYANATLLHGGTNVVVGRSDAEEMCRAIERERCTHAIVFPPTLAAMREVNSGGRFDLSNIWSTPDLSDRPTPTTMLTPRSAPWASAPGGYGQTEVGGLVTFRALAPDGQGTAGRAAPVAAVRIVDDADADVPPGETGEIVVRGLVVMNGYHRRDELNALRTRGGWHHTGDLGVRWPDGSLSFVGPKVKMIKSAAENIYPVEVEACLARHEAVKEVCVIGVPDDRFSQSVRAVVVALTPVSESDLIEYCRTKIASYKKPRSVVFADSLPRDQNGLVDRDAVDAAFGGGGYPGSRG